MLEAPRGLSHPQTSFIGTVCQGIHHTPFRAAHAPKKPDNSFLRQTTDHHTVKNDHKTIDLETRLQKRAWRNRDKANDDINHRIARVHYPVLKPPRTQETIRTRHTGRPTAPRGHPENRTRPSRGWRSGNPKAYPYHPPDPRKEPAKPTISSTPARPRENREPFPTHGPHDGRQTGVLKKLRRKEVIQPHLPVRLPCYDLVPITSLTLDGSIPRRVRPPASGATHFHDLTGGVYKARERIHRGVADPRLLATPPSWSRVADSNPN